MSNAEKTELGPSLGGDGSEQKREELERALLDERIGLVVGGRYKIVRTLGAGGMGAVYEAVHEVIGRKVAIKCLHREFARDRDAVERFRREARAATAIGNEHIVDVTDVGELPDGSPYLVMEHLTGKTLGAVIEEEGAMRVARAMHIARQVCDALADAHEKGIIHRDLKPENVFLTRRGGDPDFVKVLDFGISKTHTTDPGVSDLTRTGMAIGTPSYMSPEQAQGLRDVDGRTDVWALGVIVYEMLTKRRPFVADTYPILLMRIVGGEPVPLADWRADVPEELDALVMRCLAKQVGERVASMRELDSALSAFDRVDLEPELTASDASGAPAERSASRAKAVLETPDAHTAEIGNAVTLAHPSSPDLRAAPASVVEAPRAEPKTRPPLAIVAGVAALLGLGALGAWAFTGPSSAPPPVVDAHVEPPHVDSPHAVTPPPEPPPTPLPVALAPPPVAPVPAELRRRIESTPSGATIERDGENIGTTPMELALPGATPVEITLRLAGRRPVTQTIGPDDAETVTITLEPARRPGGSPLPHLAPH